MKILTALVTNHVLIATVSAWLIAQVVKMTINAIKEKKISPSILFSDGGMPSAHSATVVTLAIMSGIVEGVGSTIFAVAAILAMVVVNDAMGVRLEAEKHAVTIKELAKANNDIASEENQVDVSEIKSNVGHTGIEVVAGIITGIVTSVLYALIIL